MTKQHPTPGQRYDEATHQWVEDGGQQPEQQPQPDPAQPTDPEE